MKKNHEYRTKFKILKNGRVALIISSLLGSITIVSASPSDGVVTTGTATISQNANTTTINQTTQKASINWQSFSVKPNETVNFVQPSSSSVTLNRVIGVTSSLIEGTINANGQVFLLNPNGIVFSKGSSVNVGGLVASTLNMSDEDFQAGNYNLSGNSTNSILNLGTITANQNGYVVLAGKTVSNEGLIKATLGDIHLVGASKVTLNINGNSLIKLTIDKGILDSLVENKGIIQANGGEVYLTTQALDTVLNGVVNNTGIIEANSIDTHNGKIVLYAHGGTTTVDGTLSSKEGFIETSGKVLGVKESANIQTKTWLLDPTDITIESTGGTDLAGSSIKATTISTALNGGTNVILQADNDINVNETINWSQSLLTLNAGNNININTALNASNTAGLSLIYAQTTSTGTYNINAPINLASTGSFSTKYSTDAVKNYTIITSLGVEGSTTTTDLQGMKGNVLINYVLGSNIDASATSSWNSGAGFDPMGRIEGHFGGIFDGLGHTVSNLFINYGSWNNIGLIGATTASSIVKNVGVIDANFTGDGWVGGVVGGNAGIVENAYSTGNVKGTLNVGGLVGANQGKIQNSHSSANVSGTSNSIGGLVGAMGTASATIKNSYATGNVTNGTRVGGLIGYMLAGSITGSYATGNVTGTSNLGGFVGEMRNSTSTITNSYATGSVSDGIRIGGFVGTLDSEARITNSYATGKVSNGTDMGGFVGNSTGAFITNSYWDIDTTEQTNGFNQNAGGNFTNLTGIHSTTSTIDAFTQATYTGFDFTNDWIIYEGHTRPLLRTFMTPLTVTANNATKTYDGNVYNGANGVTYSTTTNSSNLLGTLNYGTDKNVGTYTLTPSGLYSNQQGYIISYANGTLTINQKPASNNQTFDTSEIKQIKTPVQNGIAFRTDDIRPQNLASITPTTIINKGMKLPTGLIKNEEL